MAPHALTSTPCHQHHQQTVFHLPKHPVPCIVAVGNLPALPYHCVNAQNHRQVVRPAHNSSPGSRGSREATAAVPHFPAKPPAPLSWLPPRNKANFRPSSQGRNTPFYSLKSWERVWRMAVAMANSKKRRERWDSSDWMVTPGKERGFPRIPTTLAKKPPLALVISLCSGKRRQNLLGDAPLFRRQWPPPLGIPPSGLSLRSSAAGPICPRTASRREMTIDRAPTTSSSPPSVDADEMLSGALFCRRLPRTKRLAQGRPQSAIRPLALGQMKRHRMRPSGEKEAI